MFALDTSLQSTGRTLQRFSMLRCTLVVGKYLLTVTATKSSMAALLQVYHPKKSMAEDNCGAAAGGGQMLRACDRRLAPGEIGELRRCGGSRRDRRETSGFSRERAAVFVVDPGVGPEAAHHEKLAPHWCSLTASKSVHDKLSKVLTLPRIGATVAERLACSPPTKEKQVQSPAGHHGFSHVGIVPGDAVGLKASLGRVEKRMIKGPMYLRVQGQEARERYGRHQRLIAPTRKAAKQKSRKGDVERGMECCGGYRCLVKQCEGWREPWSDRRRTAVQQFCGPVLIVLRRSRRCLCACAARTHVNCARLSLAIVYSRSCFTRLMVRQPVGYLQPPPRVCRAFKFRLTGARRHSEEPMRVIEINMEQRRNEGAGETGDPSENPLTNGIVQHDSHLRKSGDPARD
ncbi:hypothetical protein PR048_009544 [Dryococelus australis]|uniref:Uncharacterized protein n=1 Tax=Dryococelus australis TaxID=614101 RepID=A0ABQ9I071_9NEOP|nr:hypothetical protein PR048_009544 [Dryococelus australis]